MALHLSPQGQEGPRLHQVHPGRLSLLWSTDQGSVQHHLANRLSWSVIASPVLDFKGVLFFTGLLVACLIPSYMRLMLP